MLWQRSLSRVSAGVYSAVFLALVTFGTLELRAQSMREVFELPNDCAEFIPPEVRGTTQKWQVFVRLEHCDRMKRLERLSEILPYDQQPRFYEGVVPASRLPAEFGVDLPVLRVVFPDRTFFDTAKFSLRPEASRVADIVASSLRREPPDVTMFVAGHADRRGSTNNNEVLSIQRADAVARAIFAQGVSLSSVWRIGFGEDMPLYSGNTLDDYAANRRVEFLFAAKPEAIGMWLADEQFGELCRASDASTSDACIQSLKFSDDYTAVKLDSTSPRSISLPNPRRKRVSPNRGNKKNIRPSEKKRAQIIPASSKRIKIDPVNPHSKPVSLTL